MNRFIFTALAATTAVAALAAAAPASAQSGGYGNQGYGDRGYGSQGYGSAEVRADQLQARLQAGVRSGAITRSEAIPLRQQLRELSRLEMLYARDGISGRERSDLQQRLASLRQGLRMAERSSGDRYGRDDDERDGRDDRYGRGGRDVDSRYDRNNDGWDDRDSNRDGRRDVESRYDSNRDGYDDRDLDRDGRWDDDQDYRRTDGRGAVGEVLDRATSGGSLRVGQRVSGNLGSVPYAYRSRYRDSDSVYYRSDDRNVYQIDARTQMVVRVYPMDR